MVRRSSHFPIISYLIEVISLKRWYRKIPNDLALILFFLLLFAFIDDVVWSPAWKLSIGGHGESHLLHQLSCVLAIVSLPVSPNIHILTYHLVLRPVVGQSELDHLFLSVTKIEVSSNNAMIYLCIELLNYF